MSEILKIKTANISEEKGFNTRYDLGDLREIVTNMKANGFNESQPLIVREDPEHKGKYILGSQGHRRLASANESGLDFCYAVLEDNKLTPFDRNLDIVRLNSGEPLPMLAVTRVVMRALEDPEQTQASVAKLLGKSAMFITDCVKLSKTTKQTQKRIEQDKISAYQVIQIINDLEAKTEEGFEKVEAKVESLIEKAGDKKVTKKTKTKAEGEEGESEDEKAEREAKEKEEKEAKEAQKSRTKELIAIEKRVKQFTTASLEGYAKLTDEHDDVTRAMMEVAVTIAAMLNGSPLDASFQFTDKGEVTKQSDISNAFKNLVKLFKSTVKEVETTAKEEKKEAVDAVKTQLKETKEEAKARIAAAKAKASEKKD